MQRESASSLNLVGFSKAIALLADLAPTFSVNFSQCFYGLQFPDSKPTEFCRKLTSVFTSMPELRELAADCPGVSSSHRHVHAQGMFKFKGQSLRRAACAGRYPWELCERWAACVKECWLREDAGWRT